MNQRLGKLRISSGILITAGLMLFVALGLFFLLRSGILTPDRRNPDNVSQSYHLPDMSDDSGSTLQYYELRDRDPVQLLMNLEEETQYVWTFQSVEAWEDNYAVEKVTVKRMDEKYRIESDNLLVICDGERVYRREGMLETIMPAAEDSFHKAAGLSSLDKIRQEAEIGSVEYDNPINVRMIRIKNQDGNIRNEYEVSVETGLPVIERSYLNNMAYRLILTDSISVTAAVQLTDSDFTIPAID